MIIIICPSIYLSTYLYLSIQQEVPQPYAYEYGVNDDYSKANFKKTETQVTVAQHFFIYFKSLEEFPSRFLSLYSIK